jgi:cytochrome c556
LAILPDSFNQQLQELIMFKKLASIVLPLLFITNTALAGSDPILARQDMMEDTRDAAKVIGGMLKGEQPFDAEAAMAALHVWKKTAAEAGDMFPEGSESGHETEAKATIWTDRDGFNNKMADFGAAVDAALAANPDSLEALKGAAGPVFKTCKGCHEGYRVEKEN